MISNLITTKITTNDHICLSYQTLLKAISNRYDPNHGSIFPIDENTYFITVNLNRNIFANDDKKIDQVISRFFVKTNYIRKLTQRPSLIICSDYAGTKNHLNLNSFPHFHIVLVLDSFQSSYLISNSETLISEIEKLGFVRDCEIKEYKINKSLANLVDYATKLTKTEFHIAGQFDVKIYPDADIKSNFQKIRQCQRDLYDEQYHFLIQTFINSPLKLFSIEYYGTFDREIKNTQKILWSNFEQVKVK